MPKLIAIPFLALLTVVSGCAQKEIGVMQFNEGQVQHVVRANATPWKPCPPSLPAGCEIAILDGHPKQQDMFTVRFNMSKEIFVAPHSHPRDERVTIIKGNVAVAFGENASPADATVFGAGDYYVNAREEVHTVWINAGTVLQITGIGPWVLNYVDKNK